MNDGSQLNAGQFVDENELDLRDIISTLIENRWLIIGAIVVGLVLGGFKAFVAVPVYQADGLLQVEDASSGLGGLEVTELFASDATVSAEMEILKSRLVLGEAVDSLKLDISAVPEYFPLVGAALARRAPKSERPAIVVDMLEVPRSVSLMPLKLVVTDAENYELFDVEDQLLGNGSVGEIFSIPLQGDEVLLIKVTEMNGESGQVFRAWRSSRSSAIASLLSRMSVSEQGIWSGIISIKLSGATPDGVQQQLDAIADAYVQKSVQQKSEEVEQTLTFLDEQLPAVRSSVEDAELALNEYRLEKGSIDLTLETQSILQTVVGIEAQVNELQQERQKVTLAFTPAHPTIIALDRQIESLNGDLIELSDQVRDLPTTQQELLRLIREVEANTSLYTSMLNTVQELRVVRAGTIGKARIIDYAEVPARPISPNRFRILILGIFLGGFVGVAAAFIRKALKNGVEDPELIERRVNVPVYASIAHSKRQDQIYSDHMTNGHEQVLLATDSPDDLAIESLRNLQTALHFGTMDAKNNCMMIAGPSPGVGKSFVSANLAAVLTNNGKNVLLIDGDMRQGHLHKFLGLKKENGLSDFIGRELPIEQVIHATPINGLTLMPTGNLPPNPAELLFHKRFNECLSELIPKYDHIIIDSPPILAATDAAIIGQVAGATIMVVKSGAHPMREIEESVKRLQRAGVNLRGVVINDVKQTLSYGAGKYLYQYAYKGK